MERRITIFFISCLLLLPMLSYAQNNEITGNVTLKSNGEPLPGVAVMIEGSGTGTITDVDGKYSIQAPSGSTLVFSLLGMKPQKVTISNQTNLNVQLEENLSALEEVVVVGYGVQKKSVVTGAISSVKASDLESMPINRVEQALQGRTSGLTIASSSGQPGSGATVRVRGLTTFGNNDPLWVVDGVVVDNGGIGYLNQSDIESIEVLKDAASQAIYGARAAAGVILVTTKKGEAGKIRVNYNGYYGTSAPAKKLDLLDASQYAMIRNEAATNAGNTAPFSNPASYGAGTDWQDLIFNNSAQRQNHELSISGGNEKSTFYTSFGYLDQEGIVASEISKYKRINFRLNSEHQLASWLKVGQNLGYAHDKSIGLGNTNSEFGGPLSSAINLDPMTPAIISDPNIAGQPPYSTNPVIRDAMGRPYGISTIVAQEMTNPLAYTQTRLGNYSWSDNFVGNVYAEAEPIKGLKLRSTLGAKLSYWGSESFTPIFYLNATTVSNQTNFTRNQNRRFDWNLENTISYSKAIDQHNFTVLLGQGAYLDNRGRSATVTFFNVPANNFEDASLNFKVPNDQRNADGSEGAGHTVSSLFARANYNYTEKYLLEALVRRDGSSRFGPNNRYGIFPSFSAGWVITQEAFWPTNPVVDFLKVRGGYGIVGNDNIGDFAFLSTIGSGRNYTIGNTGSYVIGYSPNAPSNPDLKWEETSQANIGFEATLFGDFNITFDWYKKVTKGILQNPRIPGYVGAISNPAANVADMENRGVELELGYRKMLGELELSLNGNISYLENEVTNLGTDISYLSGGQSFQASSYPITRTAVGQSMNSFYGFQTQGIFQTIEDVENYTNTDGEMIQPNAQPGDFIWADLNKDGQITEADRTFIGNPTPTWSYGFTANFQWNNFDLVFFGQGVAGNKIFQGLRRLDISNANWQTEVLNRWTGPGTSNDYPRIVEGDPNKNFNNPSDFYLEDGDYFRIKTLQLGYTLPKNLISKVAMNRARVYVMSENLATFTKYSGYDPEIGGGVMSIDRGIYPQARSYMLGVQIGF
ncbi:SusC/RagA family TonB-linked outer membrane protein [Echinicola vietnamensis]|uniref:TonB-linked outer membrane protein, SusC/RagA family n=1 Tax=Echinicola vietnamensis (strain DSM 17526 / LMG 23754 / KMM 6221) TaxID=926556 RepID=L0FYK4_ECHVK|nr:TonB-dependent receptor [Echinicola vietnamensis]AGA78113.1 TonB-linked outer membrane protein, SusC/RagA family [Echinicola vietnamensis DSM 17526]